MSSVLTDQAAVAAGRPVTLREQKRRERERAHREQLVELGVDPDRTYTVEEYCSLGFDWPSELVRGKVVLEMPRPKPLHGMIVARLSYRLYPWAVANGFLAVAEAGMRIGPDPLTVRGPDLFVASAKPDGDLSEFASEPPILCIEVRSPTNSLRELREKAEEYLDCGVQIVWIVDPSDESVEVVTVGGSQVLDTRQTIPTQPGLPGLSLAVADVFAE